MYENYSFMFIPIIVDALVHVPKCIFTSIQNLQGLSFLDLQPNNFLLIFAIY